MKEAALKQLFDEAIRSTHKRARYRELMSELEQHRDGLRDKLSKARLRTLDARALFTQGRYKEFVKESGKLINILKSYKSDSYLGQLYLLTGICYNIFGDFSRAIEYELLAEKTFLAADDSGGLILTKLSQANVIRDKGLLMQALDLLLLCAGQCDKQEHFLQYIIAHFELFHLYAEVNQWQRAEQCLNRISMHLDNPELPIPHLINYRMREAELLLQQEQPQKAIEVLNKIDEIRGDFSNDYMQTGIEIFKATAFNKLNRRNDAIKHYQAAAAASERIAALPTIGKCYCRLTSTYLDQGNLLEAKRALNKAQEAAEACDAKKVLATVFQLRERIANLEKDTEAAYLAFKRQHELEKEIYQQDFKMKVEALSSLNELKQTSHHLRETRSELNIKRQELESASLFLEKKDNLIDRLDQFILSLKAEQQAREVTLDLLHKKIQEAKQLDFQQEQLKITIDQQSNDFIMLIRSRFPKITLTEARICYMITRGMSSKDIADLLVCSLKNVEQHRYRIRKKLQVPKGANFSGFLTKTLANDQ